jgi:hypothetical protein
MSEATSTSPTASTETAPATTALTAEVTQQPGTTTEAATTAPATEVAATKAEGKTEEAKAPEGAPEKYEDFTLPEGMKPIPAVMEKFQDLAKERNLSQAEAQKFADIAAEMQQAAATSQSEAIKALNNGWIEANKTDKEFGGEKLQENLAVAQKAIKAFASPELIKLLNETGFGNNPELIRAFYRAGKQMSEDTFVPAGGAAPQKSATEMFYPTMQTH